MDTNLMSKELKQLVGIYEPSFNRCLIAVTFDGRAFLIKTENHFEEAFDGSDLEDNLTVNNFQKKQEYTSVLLDTILLKAISRLTQKNGIVLLLLKVGS